MPEHVSIGINAGPLYGALGILAGVISARATGEGCSMELAQSDAAAAFDWYRSETWKAYERPEDEVTGNKSDDYERRAPGTAGMREGVRYQLYEAADGHVLFMASEQAFWKNFCEGVGRMDLFERWPGSKYADHARGNRELQAELRDIFATRTLRRVDRLRQRAQHHHRPGQHAADDQRRPPVRRSAGLPVHARRSGADQLPFPVKLVGGELPPRPRPRPTASTPKPCWPRCSASRPTRSPPSAPTAPSADPPRSAVVVPRRASSSSTTVAPSLRNSGAAGRSVSPVGQG